MNEIENEFKDKKYVVIKNLLLNGVCESLSQHLFDLHKEGKLITDEQCDKSGSVYGSPPFEKLLEELTQPLSDAIGVKLLPTYSYARLYKKGEVLKVHQDRDSCEISATLTLGHSGDKVWPIYMSKTETDGSELKLEIGDLCVYRGNELYHWRNELESEWQTQVFLHYVNADGPHKDCIYDKRSKLNTEGNTVRVDDKKKECYFWYYDDALTPEQCDAYIKEYANQQLVPGLVGGEELDEKSSLDLNVRNVNKLMLPLYKGLSSQMIGATMIANQQVWNYNITNIEQSEYLKYDINGKYESHIDTFLNYEQTDKTRKLTCLTFLNDDFEGGKLYLQVGNEKMYPPQKKGHMIVFPSFLLHGVEPVTKGVRHSVVTWAQGPSFK
jgi:hypothetical protein